MDITDYEVVGTGYKDESEIPKDDDLYYRCTRCGGFVPSVPQHSVGCKCGNVFIEYELWRLVIDDFSKMEVVRIKGEKPARRKKNN